MRRLLLLAMLLGLAPSARAEGLARRFLHRPAEAGLHWYLGTLAPVPLTLQQRTLEVYLYLLDDGRRYSARVVEISEQRGEISVQTHLSAGLVWETQTTRELLLGDLAVCKSATLDGRRGLACRLTAPTLPEELRGETLRLGYLRAAKPAW
jgi:hypothetical protein